MIKMPIKNNEHINVWFYDEQRWINCNRKIMRSNVVNDLSIEFIKEAEKILIDEENKEKEEKRKYLKCEDGYRDCLNPACEYECIKKVVIEYLYEEQMAGEDLERRSDYRGHWDGYDWIYTMNNENGWVDAFDSDDL